MVRANLKKKEKQSDKQREKLPKAKSTESECFGEWATL